MTRLRLLFSLGCLLLSGCIVNTAQPQFQKNMLVDPPLPPGYDLLGEAGDEIEGVQLTRSPDRDRVLLATPHKAPVAATAPAAAGAVAARPATLRFAALPGGLFLMEQSEPDLLRPFHA